MNRKLANSTAGTRLWRLAAVAGAAIALSFAFASGPASAEMERPLLGSFGKKGSLVTPPVNEKQKITIDADAGKFILVFDGNETPETTVGAQPAAVQTALETVLGAGAAEVEGVAGGPYTIEFRGPFGGMNVSQLEVIDGSEPLTKEGGAGSGTVETLTEGEPEDDPNFSSNDKLAYHLATKTLYIQVLDGESGLWKFHVPAAGVWEPVVEGPFIPYGYPGPGNGMDVDNTNLPTAGRIYTSTQFGRQINAYHPTGLPVGPPFPILKPNPDNPAETAVDSQGNFVTANQGNQNALAEKGVLRFSRFGAELAPINTLKQPEGVSQVAFDSEDNLYVGTGQVWKYTKASNYTESEPIHAEGDSTIEVDKRNDHLLVATQQQVWEYDEDGNLLRKFADSFGMPNSDPIGIEINEHTGEIYVSSNNRVWVFGDPVLLPDVTTERPTEVTTTGGVLHGHVDLDGGPPVEECFFEYGTDQNYTTGVVPCSPGTPIEDETDVSGPVVALNEGETYNYRLVVKTANGYNVGENETLIARNPPLAKNIRIVEVTSDKAQIEGEMNPFGVPGAEYFYEYGTEDCAVAQCDKTVSFPFVFCGLLNCPTPPNAFRPAPVEIFGLEEDTFYHFRIVGINGQGSISHGEDHTFHTFALDNAEEDPCPNANVRKQTGAARLSHCRAYELVSAADAGGYDVLSNIVSGRTPLAAYPNADDRFLYTMTDGKLPGVGGFPVNLGTDPYVAERSPDGWSTRYEGLPATIGSDSPFASTATAADGGLDVFAFADSDRCSPCFPDGSTGIPLRLANDQIVQGMKGSVPVLDPEPAGRVAKHLSNDGTHFVFGSDQEFEPAGHAGALTIYDRNLNTDTTQVVSTMPDGSTMTGEVAQLDISGDGSRVLIGRHVRTDEEQNRYYDLYMHIGSNASSVPIADTANGVLYNGMTGEGGIVYFTTADSLDDDADASADLFRATVGASSATVTRVSSGSGGTGQGDACAPPENWNVAEGGPDCSTLGIAGGGGVASGDGTVYFISPEQLDGTENDSQPNQPNLYASVPGSAPEFVALLDNSLIKPPPEPPRRPLLADPLISGTTRPHGMAIDQQTGSVYVMESFLNRVSRFTAEGAPDIFPASGTHRITGTGGTGNVSETGLDIDRAPGSPLNGAIYVGSGFNEIRIYNQNGEQMGQIEVPGENCGHAVDQANGDLYASAYPNIRRFRPKPTAEAPYDNEDFEETGLNTQGLGVCQVAVDTIGNVYGSNWSEGPVRRFPATAFEAPEGSDPGVQVTDTARAMKVDPSDNRLYVAANDRVTVFLPDGTPDGTVGLGTLTSNTAVAVNASNHHAYAGSNNNRIKLYGYEEVPFVEIAHPAVDHGREQADVRSAEDMQVTPDGDHAVLMTKIPHGDALDEGFQHVYHHSAVDGGIDCVSCKVTKAIAIGNAFLTPNGSSLSDDGRVFFTSLEQLVLRDTNRRTDAYEWDPDPEPGSPALNLVSTGTGITDAALASVDASGRNAYFFTRESIVPQDENGPVMKVYTAREGGGYGYLPEGVQCQAADECRGAGTQQPSPPPIGTYRGEGGNITTPGKRCPKGARKRGSRCVRSCRRGKVKRAGRCVRRNGKRRGHKRKKRQQARKGATRRG